MDFSGFEKLSLLDYDDKVSAILFTAGCDLRCPFCHNGELVLHPAESPTIPFSDILDYLKKRQGILDAVVISGGEPTLMPDLKEKMKAIKELGYLIKLDSNGLHPQIIKDLNEAGLIDYLAMDIKNSLAKYPLTAGMERIDLNKIQQSISYIINNVKDYEFRTTALKEFHDEESFKDIALLIKGAKRYFIQKYKDREGCIKRGFHPLEEIEAKSYQDKLVLAGIPTNLRGY